MPVMIPWQGLQQDFNPEHSSAGALPCRACPRAAGWGETWGCEWPAASRDGLPQPGAGHSTGCSRGTAAAATEPHRTDEGEGKQDSCFPCDLPGLTDASADGSDERRPTAEAGMKPDFGWNI